MIAASALDYRELARRRLPHFLFEYIDGGAYAEVTLGRNVADLQDIALRQRVLRDVSAIDLSTELLGERLSMPLALGPIGMAGLAARRGECQAVRAAHAAGVQFTLSTVSICPLEEVAAATSQPFWFQLYMLRDRGFVREMIARAKAAGCQTMLFTVDLPRSSSRYRDVRSGLAGSGRHRVWRRIWQTVKRPRWAWDVGLNGRPHILGNVAGMVGKDAPIEQFQAWVHSNFDPATSWQDLEFIRREWGGKLVIKGILDPADAREAVSLGADGLVVSNHGGRQLDGALSSARALPAIAEEVAGRISVLADSGVRSGLDVLRLLALGADGVLLGRAWICALGARGGAGVSHVLKLIGDEMTMAMMLTGCTAIDQVGPDMLAQLLQT